MDLVFRFFSISRMSSARTDVTMAQIEELAARLGDDQLVALARGGRGAARRTAALEEAHRAQTAARGDGAAAAVDKRMDTAIGGLFDGLVDEIAYLVGAGDARAEPLQRIIDLHFAGQVSTITRAPFEDELQRVERLYAELTGPSAPAIREAGLGRWVERIAEHLDPYRGALAARSRVTRGDLDSARREMHVSTCAVAGHICSAYIGQGGVIEKLLRPLVDQQDRIAQIMRARRQGVATGAVDTDIDGGLDTDLIEGDGGTFAPEGAPADDRDTAPPAVAPAVDVDPPALRPLGREDG